MWRRQSLRIAGALFCRFRALLKKVRYSAGRYYAHHVSIFYARPSGA